MLTLAAAGALWFRHGKFGIWGVILGGLAGCMTLPAIMCLLALVWMLFVTGYPRLPACRNGCCVGKTGYELKRFGDGFAWKCNCGDYYERRGRDFVFLNEEGTGAVVRTWRPLRGWFPRYGQ